MLKVYIAGPDVFHMDGQNILKMKKEYCEKKGFIGLTPFDTEVDLSNTKENIRYKIYENNIEHLKNCDIVVADLNNFRHNEQDAGTIFEIGYATALNKTIYFYSSDDRNLVEKTREKDEKSYSDYNGFRDSNDMEIENFDGRFNLMINESGTFVHGDFFNVIDLIAG